MSPFRGHHQERRSAVAIGPVPQRELVIMLRVLIDAAKAKGAGKTRDDARRTLRELLAVANWSTSYVLRNIGARRCRYLSGLGYNVPAADALRSSIERLEQWGGRG